MLINIIYGNHGLAIHIEDILEYIRYGLDANGHQVKYSQTTYETGAVNIVLEGAVSSNPEDSRAFWNQIVGFRQAHPMSRLYVITTEVLTAGGFNSSNSFDPNNKSPLHYDNQEYWIKRTRIFLDVFPFVDGLILNGEQSMENYMRLGKDCFYLPLAYPKNFVGPIKGASSFKDIDVLFTGTITPYRREKLLSLARHGLRIQALDPSATDFIRRDFFKRAKLSIGLKLAASTHLLSKYRAYYHLLHEVPHIFEPTTIPTDLDEFINFSNPDDDFAERCLELVRDDRHSDFESLFSRFKISQRLNHEKIFSEFYRFLSRN